MSKNNFVSISEQVLGDKRLTITDKVVAARILGFGEKQYFETAPKCAEFLGISEKSVQRARDHMEELGIIKKVEFDGRKNTYEISDKSYIQHHEKVEHPQKFFAKKPDQMSSQTRPNVQSDWSKCPVPTGAYKKTILKLKENDDENRGAPLPAETAGAPDPKYKGGYVDDEHLKYYRFRIHNKGVSFEDWRLAQ